MNLDEAQKKQVSAWIAEGLKLADIQKRLGAELGVTLTYMETRMLVDDLKLMPKDPPPPKAAPVPPPAPPLAGAPASSPATVPPSEIPPLGTGKVSVTVDTVARPSSIVSGGVTFTDGQEALWHLDQMGRLGLAAKQPGYKPSAADLQSFQQSLEAELSKIGF